ncbi:transcription regulator [Dioszegia hungarica]|uniref:Transcription regulator n=1 Tax=Dioszegia hungarica TaxID=4972 RepID=A0AA38H8D4_9TREE|nr:transcription regulator [Dioszegia hungarica]KAI9634744.1 transcription regulator [Dioszegia hungarica]
MAIFNRKNKDKEPQADGPTQKEKVKWSKRPANTAFKQQRLKAWQPILTPKAVLPTLFIIGLIFAPIGALIVWGSGRVTSITLDYTNCDTAAPTGDAFQAMPSGSYEYALATSSKISASSINAPSWRFSNVSSRPLGQRAQCEIQFNVPYNLGPGVFLYYRLTNYYQNHRRYVQSMDSDQLQGKYRSAADLDGGDCKPITSEGGKPYYPCGLIANSVFNDTYPSVVLVNAPNGGADQTYNFTEKGIAWGGIAQNYVATPGYASPSDVLPPPNWQAQFPTYTEFPNLRENEHFQVWMRIAALPTFRKLWARNDREVMAEGTYRITANMNYPVKQFSGTKSIVISTVAWIGGKQPFLGWAYIAAAILCVLLAVAGLVRHLVKPRKLGDMSLLSWNQPQR